MSFDLKRILESKRARRRNLANLPIAQKLAMLDALRERARTIRQAAARRAATMLRESPPEYRIKPRKD